jgi:hypothetical protein
MVRIRNTGRGIGRSALENQPHAEPGSLRSRPSQNKHSPTQRSDRDRQAFVSALKRTPSRNRDQQQNDLRGWWIRTPEAWCSPRQTAQHGSPMTQEQEVGSRWLPQA